MGISSTRRLLYTTCECLIKKLYQVCFFVSTQYQVNTLYIYNLFWAQLSITPCDNNKSIRMISNQPMNCLTALMVSDICHRASVNYTDVSLLVFTYSLYTQLL